MQLQHKTSMLAGNDRSAAFSLERQSAQNKRYTELEPEARLVDSDLHESAALGKTQEFNAAQQQEVESGGNTAGTECLDTAGSIQFN